jgi:homoserine dehydrogenase
MQEIRIVLAGLGTVGQGVYKHLLQNRALLQRRLGIRLAIHGIAVRNLRRKRLVKVPRSLLTRDWRSLIDDPRVSIVVELFGGCGEAKRLILAALRKGKSVVTANKALLAEHGEEIFEATARYRARIYFEASVAGGVPIIKALREGLVVNRFQQIYGILNGTCNYILSRMSREGISFNEALKEAQKGGYAEANPALDVDGIDAAHKVAVLASLSNGFLMPFSKVHIEGIRAITPLDIQFAHQLGYEIKLLGIVRAEDGIEARVHPVLIPKSHILAAVDGVYNAIVVRGDVVGDAMFYGRGAGPDATASAVIADISEASLDRLYSTEMRPLLGPRGRGAAQIKSIDDVVSQYYLRLSVVDRPGVLARIASVLARAQIGISSVIQPEGHQGESVPLILMIHDAKYRDMRRALRGIAKLPAVRGKPMLLRVESFGTAS